MSKTEKRKSTNDSGGEASGGPSRKRARPSSSSASADSKGDEMYSDVLAAVKRGESVIIDSRNNFTYGLPKKAKIPKTKEEWVSMLSPNEKLCNAYAQVDKTTVKIEGDLEFVDVQPVKADSNNYRFLKPDELQMKMKSMPRTCALGTPDSLASHPLIGSARNFRNEALGSASETISSAESASTAKKSSVNHEWIVWVKDKADHHYPMTVATFAHMKREGRMEGALLRSASGWQLFADEERIFIVPRDYLGAK